jgi:FkbM family methyltransferase
LPNGEVLGVCEAHSLTTKKHFQFAIRKKQPGDTLVIDEVYCHDTYRLAQLRQAPKVVFDFGSHIGTFAVLMKQLFPDAVIFCFEPHPVSFALLKANLSRFSGVHLFNKALSYSHEAILIDAEDCTGGVFVASPEDAEPYNTSEGTMIGDARYKAMHKVDTMTLEQIFAETGIRSVDYVKWDCEGGEIDAFKHMDDETAQRFKQMAGEYHVSGGGMNAFLDLARKRFPHHHFYGLDGSHTQNIGWFSADYVG